MKLRLRPWRTQDGSEHGKLLWFWCPGCNDAHAVEVGPTNRQGPVWGFNCDEVSPTLEPSVLVFEGPTNPRCHLFLRAGVLQFLGDCGHALAGQSAELPPLPGWLAD